MDQIEHKYVEANGLKLHAAEIGTGSSVVVFLHGFPEIWYTWRHQMIAVANAGFRAIAPDYRGYGLSDTPQKPEKTNFSDLTTDLLSMLDALSISKEPGRAEADFGRLDAKTVVRNIYILFSKSEIPIAGEKQEIMDLVEPSTPLPPWFSEDDLAVYGDLYEKSGFQTALQVPYRALLDARKSQEGPDPKVEVPALLIMGKKDYVLRFPGMEDYIRSGEVKKYVPNLDIKFLSEGTHFVHEQLPYEGLISLSLDESMVKQPCSFFDDGDEFGEDDGEESFDYQWRDSTKATSATVIESFDQNNFGDGELIGTSAMTMEDFEQREDDGEVEK